MKDTYGLASQCVKTAKRTSVQKLERLQQVSSFVALFMFLQGYAFNWAEFGHNKTPFLSIYHQDTQ
jgi:hypothetical protein